jgi:hypothetical protein
VPTDPFLEDPAEAESLAQALADRLNADPTHTMDGGKVKTLTLEEMTVATPGKKVRFMNPLVRSCLRLSILPSASCFLRLSANISQCIDAIGHVVCMCRHGVTHSSWRSNLCSKSTMTWQRCVVRTYQQFARVGHSSLMMRCGRRLQIMAADAVPEGFGGSKDTSAVVFKKGALGKMGGMGKRFKAGLTTSKYDDRHFQDKHFSKPSAEWFGFSKADTPSTGTYKKTMFELKLNCMEYNGKTIDLTSGSVCFWQHTPPSSAMYCDRRLKAWPRACVAVAAG